MIPYQKLYTLMFNAATDALEELDELNIGQAKMLLKQAQIRVEELYLEGEEPCGQSTTSCGTEKNGIHF